jgi:hypothetical protein
MHAPGILDTIVQTNVLLVCTHYHIGLINTDFNELLTLPEHQSSHPVFSGVRVIRSIVFCVMFCRTLFILLSFFCWPLCCLSFLDLRDMITSLRYLQTLLTIDYVVEHCNIIFNDDVHSYHGVLTERTLNRVSRSAAQNVEQVAKPIL